MAQEGIASALRLDDAILQQLDTAQKKIEEMRRGAEGLASSFVTISSSITDISKSLKGTGANFQAIFNTSGVLQSISLITGATAKIGTTASSAAKEAASAAKQASKQAQGEFVEYIQSLTRTNDGLKQMNAYYRELEKSSARAAGAAAKNISAHGREVDKIAAQLNTVGKNAQMVQTLLSQAFSPFILQRFLQRMIEVRGEFEISLKTLGAIIGDMNKAESMFTKIQGIALRSPFSVQELLKQTKQLSAYRIETDKLIETTKMLGDISAGVGVDMNRLILAYGQVRAAEFLKGQESRQFYEAGVNLLGGLAERYSELYDRVVSVGEVMQMVSKRMVKFADVDAVLRSMVAAGGAFYKMQEKQADTISGRISNLKDRIQIMFNEIGKSYDEVIGGVITGLERVISNWKLISTIVMPLLTGKLFSGAAALIMKSLKDIPVMWDEIRNQIVRANFQVLTMGKNLTIVRRGVAAIRGAIKALGVTGVVQILFTILSLVGEIYRKVTQFKREIKDIAKEAEADAAQQVSEYNKLLDIASDLSEEPKARKEALDSLKSSYGNIINLQGIELDNIDKLNESRQQQIDLIRKQAAEQARTQALNKLASESQQKSDRDAANLISRIRIAGNMYGGVKEMKAALKVLDKVDVKAIRNDVADAILGGTIEGEEAAAKEFARRLLLMAGSTEREAERIVNSLDSGFVSSLGSVFGEISKKMSYIDGVIEKRMDTTVAKAARPYLALINNIEEARKSFENKPEYDTNPQQKELDYYEHLKKWRDEIKQQIDEGALGDIPAHIKEQLDRSLEKAFQDEAKLGGVVEQYLRDFGASFNRQFPDMITPFGVGVLKRDAETDIEAFAKQVNDVLEEYRDLLKRLNEDGAVTLSEIAAAVGYGFESIEQAKAGLAYSINGLEYAVEFLGPPKPKNEPDGPKGPNTYLSDLKAFLSDLKNARKEMDKLTDAEDRLYVQRLQNHGRKVGIKIADDFEPTKEVLDEIINKYLPKLEEADQLDLRLTWSREETADSIKGVTDEISRLWDVYQNSQKMEEWGFIPQEGSAKEVLERIVALEQKLRDQNTEDSIRAAEDTKKRRLEIARTEAEEAAKLMYEANKKALDRVSQIFLDVRAEFAKYPDAGLGEAAENTAMQSRMAKALKDVSDAQWDAFKSTKEYTLAFGNLEGLSNEVLKNLKQTLEYWKTNPNGALAATELQRLERALIKINEATDDSPIKSYFDALQDSAQQLNSARAVRDTFGALEAYENLTYEAAKAARTAYDDAAAAAKDDPTEENLNKQQKAYEELEKAQSRHDDAIGALSDAQERYGRLLDATTRKLKKIKDLYGAVTSAFTGAVDFAKETIEALGGEIDDTTVAIFDGLSKGISVVEGLQSMIIGIKEAWVMLDQALKDGKIAKWASLGLVGAALLGIGAAIAAIQVKDQSLQNQIENHKNRVERLERTYDRLNDAMDRAMDIDSAREYYAAMNANIAKQRQELQEAIEASKAREAKHADAYEETKDLQNQLEDLDEKILDTREKWLDMLGGVTDPQSEAKDWSKSWLDAFKETGDGLSALQEDFDALYENLAVGQLWSKIMGPRIENLANAVNDALADGDLTETEAAAIRAYRASFAQANEDLKQRAESLGILGGALSGSTLQRGVETVTEKTSEAIESILNATRYDVSDTNTRLARMEEGIIGEGENTILSHLRSQTRYLADIARIASAVYYPGGHPKGAGALKVITEMA